MVLISSNILYYYAMYLRSNFLSAPFVINEIIIAYQMNRKTVSLYDGTFGIKQI
jgi:hypothetical protein